LERPTRQIGRSGRRSISVIVASQTSSARAPLDPWWLARMIPSPAWLVALDAYVAAQTVGAVRHDDNVIAA